MAKVIITLEDRPYDEKHSEAPVDVTWDMEPTEGDQPIYPEGPTHAVLTGITMQRVLNHSIFPSLVDMYSSDHIVLAREHLNSVAKPQTEEEVKEIIEGTADAG